MPLRLFRGRGWRGESKRHSIAAKKGWMRRRTPHTIVVLGKKGGIMGLGEKVTHTEAKKHLKEWKQWHKKQTRPEQRVLRARVIRYRTARRRFHRQEGMRPYEGD